MVISTRSAFLLLAAAAVSIGLVSCSTTSPIAARPPAHRVTTPSSMTSGSVPSAVTASPAGPSKALTGLIDMGSQKPYAENRPFPTTTPAQLGSDAAAFSGMVINESWAQLEPTAGKPDWTPLDASLAAISTYNAAHPADRLQAKFRIFPGYEAPAWAKALDGGPITVTSAERGHDEAAGTVGRWWDSDYRAAWAAFNRALAARYDTDPLIGMVAATSCAARTGEAFILGQSKSLFAKLMAAGWSSAQQQACIEGAFDDYSGWHHTPVGFSVGTFRVVAGDGTSTLSPTISDQIMTQCVTNASHGGFACYPANEGLSDTVLTRPAGAATYTEFNTLAANYPGQVTTALQTVGAIKAVGCEAIAIAVGHHADSVELWAPGPKADSGFPAVPEPTLAAWNHDLKTHTGPMCPASATPSAGARHHRNPAQRSAGHAVTPTAPAPTVTHSVAN